MEKVSLENEACIRIAKDLAREFQNSEVVVEWLKLNDAVSADKDLLTKLYEIDYLQQQAQKNEITPEEMGRISDLRAQVSRDPVYRSANEAYDKVVRLADYVNNLLAAGFDGEDVSGYTEEHFLEQHHHCGDGCGCGEDGCGCGCEDGCGCGDDECGCGHCH